MKKRKVEIPKKVYVITFQNFAKYIKKCIILLHIYYDVWWGIYIFVQIRFSFSQNSGKKPIFKFKKISEIIIFLFGKIFSYNYQISVK